VARFAGLWNRLEEVVAGWTLLGLALFCFLQVVLRYTFSSGFHWAEEVGRYVSVFLTFLGASLGVKYGTHFAVDALLRLVPGRLAQFLKGFSSVLAGVLFLVVARYGWLQITKLGHFGASSAALQIPMWVPYLPIPFFSVVIGLRFFVDAGKRFRLGAAGTPYRQG
jgi:C4-dicarboxylate transporter, DctQ subunit